METKRTLEDAKKELNNNVLILENKNTILLFNKDEYIVSKKTIWCQVFTKLGKFKYHYLMNNDWRLYKRLHDQLN
ncbi:hypothetical protein [uncultured Brachyspira sp.]|uniref:hypothetical protein n=1 Tax=uncultured Brachyspira sp. TaxID=221953 RepID=UPI002590A9A5|nr:hypothetical protein [uncultured Brachyspira sp.]